MRKTVKESEWGRVKGVIRRRLLGQVMNVVLKGLLDRV